MELTICTCCFEGQRPGMWDDGKPGVCASCSHLVSEHSRPATKEDQGSIAWWREKEDPSAAGKTDQELFAAELHRIAVAVETGFADVEWFNSYPGGGGRKTEVLIRWPSTSSTSPSPRTSY